MDCCALPSNTASAGLCSRCGQQGKSVAPVTLFHMVNHDRLNDIGRDGSYFYCGSADCPVVYFSNSLNQYFTKTDVRIRVGVKEKEPPIQLCYCFDYTVETIRQEIERTGATTATEEISDRVKAGLCACEIRNPAGHCCLGNLSAVIKAIMKEIQPA